MPDVVKGRRVQPTSVYIEQLESIIQDMVSALKRVKLGKEVMPEDWYEAELDEKDDEIAHLTEKVEDLTEKVDELETDLFHEQAHNSYYDLIENNKEFEQAKDFILDVVAHFWRNRKILPGGDSSYVTHACWCDFEQTGFHDEFCLKLKDVFTRCPKAKTPINCDWKEVMRAIGLLDKPHIDSRY